MRESGAEKPMLSRRGFRRALVASIVLHVVAFLTVPLKGPVGEARDLVIKRVTETAVKFVRIVKPPPPPPRPKVAAKPLHRPRYVHRRVRRIVRRPVPRPQPQPEQSEALPQPPEATILPPAPVEQPEEPTAAPEPEPEPVVVHPTPPEQPVPAPPRVAEAPQAIAEPEKPAPEPSPVLDKAVPESVPAPPAPTRIAMASTAPAESKPAPVDVPATAPKPSLPAPSPALPETQLALLAPGERPAAAPAAEAITKAAPSLPGVRPVAATTSPAPAQRVTEGMPEAAPVRLAEMEGRAGPAPTAAPPRPWGTGAGSERRAPALSAGEAPAGREGVAPGAEKGTPGRFLVALAPASGLTRGAGGGEGGAGSQGAASPLRVAADRPGGTPIRPIPGGDIGYVVLPPGGSTGGFGVGEIPGEAPGGRMGGLYGPVGDKAVPGGAGRLAALPQPGGAGGEGIGPGAAERGAGEGILGGGPAGRGPGTGQGIAPAGTPQGLGLGGIAGVPGGGPGTFGLPGGTPGAGGIPGAPGDVLVFGPPGIPGGEEPAGEGFGMPAGFDKGVPGGILGGLVGPLRVVLGGPRAGPAPTAGGVGAEAGGPVRIALGGLGHGLAGFGLPILPDASAPMVVAGLPAGGPGGVGLLPGSPQAKSAPGGLYVGVSGSFDLPMGVTSSDYQTDSPGMVNLLAEVRARTNVHVTVQERFVPLTLDNIRHLPVLHLRGHRAFSFTPEEREALRQYVAQGGTIFAEDSHGPFGECLRRELKKIFGVAPRDLPPDHEIYRAFYVLDDIPVGDMGERYPLQGIPFGDRLGVIFSRNDYGDCWEGTGGWVKPESREPAFKMGINIFVYIAAHWKKHKLAGP